MAGTDLNLSGAIRRTNKGNVDFYYGGGDEAWANLAAAYAGIPSAIRNGKVFGVITGGVISEYWWNDATALANGDEVPYAQGGSTILSIDIINADLITAITNSTIQIGVKYRVTDCPQGVVWVYGIDANVVSTQAQLEGTWDGTTWVQGAWGSYDVNSGSFKYATRVAQSGNIFIGGNNLANVLTLANANIFYDNADSNEISGTYNVFNSNCQNIKLNQGNFNVFGFGVQNFDVSANADFNLCNVVGGGYSAIDFTNAAQLFGRADRWSIDKVLGTNLIEVTFDSNLATAQTGSYDTDTDTFTPYSGTWTPTLTPDGSVCTGAAVNKAYYSKSGNMVNVFLSLRSVAFDFSIGLNGSISIIDLPLPTTTAIVIGTAQVNVIDGAWMAALSGKIFIVSLDDKTVSVYCEDSSFSASGLFFNVQFSYEIN